MSDEHPQPALREWRAHFSHPVTLVLMGCAGFVLGLAGPFGTDVHLSLLPRLGYWLALVLATYSAGFVVSTWLRRRTVGRGLWVAVLIEGLATGLLIIGIVLAMNAVVFGWVPSLPELPGFVATLLAITLIVTAALHVAAGHRVNVAATGPAPAQVLPPILSRIPLEKRGALVALSVEDHYVRVHTVKGEELLLMRLSDAIGEVGETAGAQVHRSYWAAFDQVSAVRREGDRAVLTMKTGIEVPVSRANMARIREARLLPR